jgi:hypothetical protein
VRSCSHYQKPKTKSMKNQNGLKLLNATIEVRPKWSRGLQWG